MHPAIASAFAGTRDAALSPEDRAQVLARQDDRCFHCGLPLTPDVIMDHLTPRHAGGSHDLTNRVASHVHCDGEKAGRMPTPDELARLAAQLNPTEGH